MSSFLPGPFMQEELIYLDTKVVPAKRMKSLVAERSIRDSMKTTNFIFLMC